jgi:hypothetical protein
VYEKLSRMRKVSLKFGSHQSGSTLEAEDSDISEKFPKRENIFHPMVPNKPINIKKIVKTRLFYPTSSNPIKNSSKKMNERLADRSDYDCAEIPQNKSKDNIP